MICERFQHSTHTHTLLLHRAGAAVAKAVIKDLQESVQIPNSLLVDRSKLRRERKRFRHEARLKDEKYILEINAIYTDGRKDATLVQQLKKNSD